LGGSYFIQKYSLLVLGIIHCIHKSLASLIRIHKNMAKYQPSHQKFLTTMSSHDNEVSS